VVALQVRRRRRVARYVTPAASDPPPVVAITAASAAAGRLDRLGLYGAHPIHRDADQGATPPAEKFRRREALGGCKR
jgi:hypothetical protein